MLVISIYTCISEGIIEKALKANTATLKRDHKSACFTDLLADSISKNVMAFAESVGPDFVDGLLQTGQYVVKNILLGERP